MKKYNSSANIADANASTAIRLRKRWSSAQGCGDDLTRENLMKQAASIHDLKLPMLLPGITSRPAPTDFAPIKQMQLEKLDGTTWQLFGEVISGTGS